MKVKKAVGRNFARKVFSHIIVFVMVFILILIVLNSILLPSDESLFFGLRKFVDFIDLPLKETLTSPGDEFSLNEIINSAHQFANQMEGNRLIPSQINIGTKTISDAEFLGLLVDSLELILSNEIIDLTTKVRSRTINSPANKYPPADLLSAGNQELYEKPLTKEEYNSLVNSVKNSLTSGNTPQITNFNNGEIRYPELIYLFSSILRYHKFFGKLPRSYSLFVISPKGLVPWEVPQGYEQYTDVTKDFSPAPDILSYYSRNPHYYDVFKHAKVIIGTTTSVYTSAQKIYDWSQTTGWLSIAAVYGTNSEAFGSAFMTTSEKSRSRRGSSTIPYNYNEGLMRAINLPNNAELAFINGKWLNIDQHLPFGLDVSDPIVQATYGPNSNYYLKRFFHFAPPPQESNYLPQLEHGFIQTIKTIMSKASDSVAPMTTALFINPGDVKNYGAQYIVDKVANSGFNTIIFTVKPTWGGLYYNTRDTEFVQDLLTPLMTEAKKKNLKVYAAFSVLTDFNAIHVHPEWKSKKVGEDPTTVSVYPIDAVSPCILEYKQRMKNLISDVINAHNVDGIIFSDVYLSPEYDENPACTNKASVNWREQLISQYANELTQHAKQICIDCDVRILSVPITLTTRVPDNIYISNWNYGAIKNQNLIMLSSLGNGLILPFAENGWLQQPSYLFPVLTQYLKDRSSIMPGVSFYLTDEWEYTPEFYNGLIQHAASEGINFVALHSPLSLEGEYAYTYHVPQYGPAFTKSQYQKISEIGLSVQQCLDNDKDRYGDDCSLGLDCDDITSDDPAGCPTSKTNCNEVTSRCAICINKDAVESCDNVDNDCDGTIDRNARACPQLGVCAAGTQTCSAGTWGQCSIQPGIESAAVGTCANGRDDDCDGKRDWDTQQWFNENPIATGTIHGDDNCPVSVTAISVSPNQEFYQANSIISVSCTSNVAKVNSIFAYVDNDNNGIYSTGDILCSGAGSWNGNTLTFSNCNLGNTGNKKIACGVGSSSTEPFDRSYQLGNDRTISIVVGNVNRDPVISSVSANPINVFVSEVIRFSVTASDPDNDILGYSWDFGDGEVASGDIVNHVYNTANTYNVRVIVTDGKGGTAIKSININIIQPCRLTNAYWSTTIAQQGQEISLIVEGTNCEGKIADFTVWEEDENSANDIAVLQPTSTTFSAGKSVSKWGAEWQCDGEDPFSIFCIGGNPEYYFVVNVRGDGSISSDGKDNGILVVIEVPPTCGNKFTQPPEEECDDGNNIDTDTCNKCKLTLCGDGITQNLNGQNIREVCDGNSIFCSVNNYAGRRECNAQCNGFNLCRATESCGDGRTNGNEQCDDGINNGRPNYCNVDCRGITPSVCRNSEPEVGEECDDGNDLNNDECNSECKKTSCGDWIIQNPNGFGLIENCDDGILNGQPNKCNLQCSGITLPTCRNNEPEAGEQCDDGNENNNDACTNSCRNAICGDTITRTNIEECDDGISGSSRCTTGCRLTTCGDGIIQNPNGFDIKEICDGNNIACSEGGYRGTASCRENCLRFSECVLEERCGDRIIQSAANEQCDDGNNLDGDGCSAKCEIETLPIILVENPENGETLKNRYVGINYQIIGVNEESCRYELRFSDYRGEGLGLLLGNGVGCNVNKRLMLNNNQPIIQGNYELRIFGANNGREKVVRILFSVIQTRNVLLRADEFSRIEAYRTDSSLSQADELNDVDFHSIRLVFTNNNGIIEFNSAVDLIPGRELTSTEEKIIDFDSFVDILEGKITVNTESGGLAMFKDVGAKLTFNNIKFNDPVLYKDGQECNGCSRESYSNGIAIFIVPGFSEYIIAEKPAPPEPPRDSRGGGGGGGDGGGGGGIVTQRCDNDGILETRQGEECDKNDLGLAGSNLCKDYDVIFNSGILSCTSQCKLNASLCGVTPPHVRPGIIDIDLIPPDWRRITIGNYLVYVNISDGEKAVLDVGKDIGYMAEFDILENGAKVKSLGVDYNVYKNISYISLDDVRVYAGITKLNEDKMEIVLSLNEDEVKRVVIKEEGGRRNVAGFVVVIMILIIIVILIITLRIKRRNEFHNFRTVRKIISKTQKAKKAYKINCF